MEALDSIGRRYGRRPSEIMGISNPFQAYSVDLWAHNYGVQRQNLEVVKRTWKGNRGRR